jgi:hypothetical protein
MPNTGWEPGAAVRVVTAIEHAEPPIAAGMEGVYREAEWTSHPHSFEIELLAVVDFPGRDAVHCRFAEICPIDED